MQLLPVSDAPANDAADGKGISRGGWMCVCVCECVRGGEGSLASLAIGRPP